MLPKVNPPGLEVLVDSFSNVVSLFFSSLNLKGWLPPKLKVPEPAEEVFANTPDSKPLESATFSADLFGGGLILFSIFSDGAVLSLVSIFFAYSLVSSAKCFS